MIPRRSSHTYVPATHNRAQVYAALLSINARTTPHRTCAVWVAVADTPSEWRVNAPV